MNSLTAIFDWLLTASLRASVLTLAVLLVQFVFRRRLSARARYALWLPVLIVLLTPVLPRSRWSIENLVAESLQPVSVTQIINPAPVVISSSTAEITAPAAEPVDWSYIRLTAWISVSAAMLLISGLSYLRTLRRFQRARMPLSAESTSQLAQIAREVGLRRAPRVWCSSAVTSPAVTGLLRPLLLLPADFEQKFTDSEARLILQHELTHLKRHDLPLNALLCVLIALHWFNPVLWLAFFTARLHREGACDAQVLENATPRRRAEYGHALLKVEAAFCPRGLSLGFVGIFERGSALRSRIRAIAHPHSPHPVMKLITLASISLMVFFGVTRAENPPPAPKSDAAPQQDSVQIDLKFIELTTPNDSIVEIGTPSYVKDNALQKGSIGRSRTLLTADKFDALMKEVEGRPEAQVLCTPQILTRSGEAAQVTVGRKAEIAGNPKPVGLDARFTPQLRDGAILLDYDLQYTETVNPDTGELSNQGSALRSLDAKDEKMIPAGQSAVLCFCRPTADEAKVRQLIITISPKRVVAAKSAATNSAPDFNIGKTEFRPGDSIRITHVQRGDDFLTVTADYELASEPEATISLQITRTKGDGRSKTAASQFKKITKGKGTVTLHHPAVGEGMPHVSFYPSKGGSVFGGVYFSTVAGGAASKKMKSGNESASNFDTSAPAAAARAQLYKAGARDYVFEKENIHAAFLRLAKDAGIQFVLLSGDHPKMKFGTFNYSKKDNPFHLLEVLTRICRLSLTYDNGIWHLKDTEEEKPSK